MRSSARTAFARSIPNGAPVPERRAVTVAARATPSRLPRERPFVVFALLALLSCGESPVTPPRPPPPPPTPRPTTVEVTPASSELSAIGASVRLSAEVRDQRGQPMTGITVTWTTNADAIATVDAAGLVTAVRNGSAAISATAESASGRATVTVTQRVGTVTVSPPGTTVVQGDTVRLRAAAHDANGHPVDPTEFSWTSSDSAVATVDSLGLVTGLRRGDAEISATADGVTGTAALHVERAAPERVEVAPDSVHLTARGDTARLTAEVRDQLGRIMSGVTVSWNSSAPGVAEVDAAGLVTAVRNGSAAITATAEAASGTATVTVSQRVGTVTVSPAEARVVEGDTVRLRATAHDANGHPVDATEFSWTSNFSAVATVDSLGLVTGLRHGDAEISATARGVRGTAALHVERAAPERVEVAPDSVHLTARRDTARLTAEVRDQLGRIMSGVTVSWKSSAPGVAEVDATGLVTAVRNGSAVISATAERASGTATITVTGTDPDREILEAFYQATGGSRWHRNYGWATDAPLHHWYGVRIGGGGRVTDLVLRDNGLVGGVPPDVGALGKLRALDLTNNTGMSGELPLELTNLQELARLFAGGTGLCAPAGRSFAAWLNSIRQLRLSRCSSSEATAYLTQAVQSLEFPVPLIAGEEALLRIFVTSARRTSERIPPVRATFFVDGEEAHVAEISRRTAALPTAVDQSSLSRSSNVLIPGHVVRPGLEMVVEIDPRNTLDPGLGVANRIPEEGRMPLDVRMMPFFDLTVIPLLWRTRPDSAAVEYATGMAADPENHGMLWQTRTLLPVGELDVTMHESVWSSANDAATLFRELEAIYTIEGARNYYLGLLSGEIARGAIGLARPFGKVSFSIDDPGTIAHEFGHNFGLGHTPCVHVRGDPNYPDPDGFIASWGYDFRDGGSLIAPDRFYDLMSYCHPRWIAEYTFSRMVGYRDAFARSQAEGDVASPGRSLLLWGGAMSDGQLFLEPVFVVNAPPRLPESTGPYRLSGTSPAGVELFSLSFDMLETADGGGESSFAFTLPVEHQWAGRLATVTVSGPLGSLTLDRGSDLPMALLLDPDTGHVRGFLRNQPSEALARAQAAELGADTELDVLFSRGIPDASAWRRY